MERLAHRDLRNRSGQVLRDVAAGASYEITNHGDVVAVLCPPAATAGPRARHAVAHGGFAQLSRMTRDRSVHLVLDDLRGER